MCNRYRPSAPVRNKLDLGRLTTLEAARAAVGYRVVTSDLLGSPDEVHLRGDQVGFVYRTNEELVAHLERLRTDPTLRDTLGAAGRAALGRLWSEDAHLDRYLAAIEEARQGRG